MGGHEIDSPENTRDGGIMMGFGRTRVGEQNVESRTIRGETREGFEHVGEEREGIIQRGNGGIRMEKGIVELKINWGSRVRN